MTDGDPGDPGDPGDRAPELSARQRFPVSFAVFAVSRTHRAAAGALLRDLGLHPGQEIMLLQLWDNDHQSQNSLAATLRLDHSTVAKSIKRLADAGLVTRARSARDGRVTVVSLTDAGRAMEARVAAAWAELEDRSTTLLDQRQRARFVELATLVETSVLDTQDSPGEP